MHNAKTQKQNTWEIRFNQLPLYVYNMKPQAKVQSSL